MKKILYFCVAALALAISCSKPEVPGENENPTDNIDRTGKHECLLPEIANGKTAWVPGDQIVVHGEYTTDQKTFTLTAEDISADGKKCYVDLTGIAPYEQKKADSKFVAAYPGEFVKNAQHCKDENTFVSTNALLMGGYDSGNQIIFESIVGGFAFTITADVDSYEFMGNNEEYIAHSSIVSKILAKSKLYVKSKDGNISKISGKVVADGSTVNHICFPNEPNLTDGFILTFYKDKTPVKVLYSEETYETKRKEFISLGDITSKVIDYKAPEAETHVSAIPTASAIDLGAKEKANCYIVNNPGVYKFKAVKGASTESLPSLGSVEVLWETWNNSEKVTPNSVVAQVDFEKDYIYFRVDESGHAGNAVIAAKNDMGAITWSWHIWVPETEIEENLYGISRHSTMDRNLGALVAASPNGATPESFGLMYQWGRKDPFVGAGNISTGKAATVAGQAMTLNGDKISADRTIKTPTVFGIFQGNWNSSTYEEFWGESKQMNDPCPPGYKVPYRSEHLLFTTNPKEMVNWEFDPSNYLFTLGNPETTFPLSGYITWNGEYTGVGTHSYLWAASTGSSSTAQAYNFRVQKSGDNASYGNSSKEKANAYAVRCVAKAETPFENYPGAPVQGSYTKYKAKLQELSGLCLHNDKSFLWGVGDQGSLVKIDFEGNVTTQLTATMDAEAITINPETGDLYIGCEQNYVFKVAAPEYNTVTDLFRVADAVNFGNSGVEGITWYKDGMILVGAQTDALLWAYTLDGTVVWKKSLRSVAIGITEIADMHYDPVRDQLWVISSNEQAIYVFNGDASEHIATYKVGYAGNCESVHVDYGNSCVWVADDDTSSTLFKIDFTF